MVSLVIVQWSGVQLGCTSDVVQECTYSFLCTGDNIQVLGDWLAVTAECILATVL